jgi:hypothetical protein
MDPMRLLTTTDPVEGLVIQAIAKKAGTLKADTYHQHLANRIAGEVSKLFKK